MGNDENKDRALGMDRPITRRDFLNGVAVGVGAVAAGNLAPGFLYAADSPSVSQDTPGYYPPALTGMRGSNDGSFESAHALRDHDFWKTAGTPVDLGETYDLVVVGSGIGGLAAAHFFRQHNRNARVLILDNHDDFGGHARRDEFHPGGRLLLANGGTWAIESPFPYSAVAGGLLRELGIDPPALARKCYDRDVYKGLGTGVFFDKETFGEDKLVTGVPFGRRGQASGDLQTFLEKIPLAPAARRGILSIEQNSTDHFPGLASDAKKDKLSRMSYKDYLLKVIQADPGVIPFYQTRTHGLFGVGIDAVSALDCWGLHFPGFGGLNLDPGPYPRMGFTAKGAATPKPPFDFHFPDGNASIARMLVRKLIPDSVPGHTPEDIVTAKLDYTKLDAKGSPVRIRLSSTVVRARHAGDPATAGQVDVCYIRDKKVYCVKARGVIMACWNMMIPYLCPELPEAQQEALRYGVKVPLVYTAVALRNWHSWHKLGIHQVSTPGMYHSNMNLDLAVDIGDYKAPRTPGEPILVRMLRTPCLPGLSERDQHRAGRGDLLTTSFETFERNIRDQLARCLSGGGFDPARDIDAITVNRWPHGYAYEYNPLFDPDWKVGESPCEIARKRFGRITIANSDAAAAAYTDQAIDQGYRALQELLAV